MSRDPGLPRRGLDDAGVRATSDLSKQGLGVVLRLMRVAEDVRRRALSLHDLELVRCAGEASDAAVRRERLAETAREFGAWG